MQFDLHGRVLICRKSSAGSRFKDHAACLSDRYQGFCILEKENCFYRNYVRIIFADETKDICSYNREPVASGISIGRFDDSGSDIPKRCFTTTAQRLHYTVANGGSARVNPENS